MSGARDFSYSLDRLGMVGLATIAIRGADLSRALRISALVSELCLLMQNLGVVFSLGAARGDGLSPASGGPHFGELAAPATQRPASHAHDRNFGLRSSGSVVTTSCRPNYWDDVTRHTVSPKSSAI